MVGPEELNTRHGSRMNKEQLDQSITSSIQLCTDRLSNVLNYPLQHLSEEVFNKEDRNTIENVRYLVSLSIYRPSALILVLTM